MSSTAVDFTPRGVKLSTPRGSSYPIGHICDICHRHTTFNMLCGRYICDSCTEKLQQDYHQWQREVCETCTRKYGPYGCAGCVIPETRNITFAEWLDDYLEYYLEE